MKSKSVNSKHNNLNHESELEEESSSSSSDNIESFTEADSFLNHPHHPHKKEEDYNYSYRSLMTNRGML